MAALFRMVRPSLLARPAANLPVALGLGTASGLLVHMHSSQPLLLRSLRCDSPAAGFSSGARAGSRTPVVKDGRINPRIFRQVSTGSIVGLLGGLVVSAFSKPLALLIGILVIGAQAVESKFGLQLIPYGRLQRVFRQADVKGALRDNVALKVSFGVTFALAAFAEF